MAFYQPQFFKRCQGRSHGLRFHPLRARQVRRCRRAITFEARQNCLLCPGKITKLRRGIRTDPTHEQANRQDQVFNLRFFVLMNSHNSTVQLGS